MLIGTGLLATITRIGNRPQLGTILINGTQPLSLTPCSEKPANSPEPLQRDLQMHRSGYGLSMCVIERRHYAGKYFSAQ